MDHQGRRPYRRDDADNESVQDLRELFLKAYSEHDSSLLRGLCKGPLTAFKALDNADKDDWDLVGQYPESAALVEALFKWAKAHYLTWKGAPSSWVMNAALANPGTLREVTKEALPTTLVLCGYFAPTTTHS